MNRAWHRSIGLSALAFALFFGAGFESSAAAQRGHDAETPEYKKLIQDGLQEFDHGNWEEATALFQQAHAMNPNARTLRALGLCAFEARRYSDALKLLKAALEDRRKPLTQQQRSELQRSVERAQQYVGGLKLAIEPATATVRINGQPVTLEDDSELVVDPGQLEIEVSSPGYQTELRRVRVASQSHEALTIKLASADVASETGAAPAAAQTETQLATAAPQRPPADSGGGGSLGALKWVAGGFAVAGLAVGLTALVLANSDAGTWNKCRDLTQASCANAHDRSQTETKISIAGFVAGGSLAALTAVLFVLDAHNGAAQTTARICGPGGSGFGLQCRVRF